MKDEELITMLVNIKYDIKSLKEENNKLKEDIKYYRDLVFSLKREVVNLQTDFILLNNRFKKSKRRGD